MRTYSFRPALPAIALALAILVATSSTQIVTAGGPTIIVSETADELNADGDCSLREAIKATRENAAVDACPGGVSSGSDTIVLESGATYDLSIVGDGEDEGDLDTGGTSAGPLFMRSEPGPGNATIDANGIDRVLEVGFGIDVEIRGITFTGGNAPPATAGGGGIKNHGTLHLISVAVIDNFTPQFGGGIANRIDDTLVIEDSLVADNVAEQDGGGISSAGPLTVERTVISGNTTEENFGGGFSVAGPATVTDSLIIDNHAPTGFGGGISNIGVLTVERTLITANMASVRGGGISNGATSSLETVTLINSTISGNTAGEGAAINDQGEGVTLLNVTLASNQATDPGQPDSLSSSFSGFYEITNSIISNVEAAPAGSITNPNCDATITSGGNNLESGDSCDFDTGLSDIINTDPLLGPLADNGGPTETHALLAGSPALSAANGPSCPPDDQRGEARPQGDGCDIGAYESSFNAPPPTPTPSPIPTPSPTPEPGPDLIQGDNDCDTSDVEDPDVDAVDALVGLQFVAALPYNQQPDCIPIGNNLVPAALPAGQPPDHFGDIDCDLDVDAVDALQILRHVAALPVNQTEPCTDVGNPL